MLMDAIAITGIVGVALPKMTWPLFIIGWLYYLWRKRSVLIGTQMFLVSFRYPIYVIASGLALFLTLSVYEHYRFVNYGIVSEEPMMAMTVEEASEHCKRDDPNGVLLIVINKDTNATYGRCDEPFKFSTYQIIQRFGTPVM